MEQQKLLEEMIRAAEAGEPADLAQLDGCEVSLLLIEQLKQRVDQAIRSDARQALRLAEITHRLSLRAADPLARALGLRAQAQALHVSRRQAEALELYLEAAALYCAGNRPVEAARTVRAMVDALMYLGRYDEALAKADEARQVFETHGERLLLAQLETNVGNIHHRLDQYRQALACYERARVVFAEADDATALAVVALNCANIHSSLDDFRQAQELYEQACDLYESRGMTLAAAQARYSLGYLRFLKGESHAALRVLHAARRELGRLGDGHFAALCDLDLAEIYLQLNVPESAARHASEAHEQFQAAGVRFEAARALTWLGLAYLQQEQLAEAANVFTAAEQAFAAEGNEIQLGLLRLYSAELHLRRGQPDEAHALATAARELFVCHELKAKSCYAQLVAARALEMSGATDAARALGEQTLTAMAELDAPWLAYQVHELLGDLALAAGAAERASEHYVHSVGCIEQLRSGIRVDEYRSAFVKGRLSVYAKLIRLCLAAGSERQAEAFYYLESCKARTLVDLLVNQLEVIPTETDGASGELWRQWRRLREELRWFYSRVSQSELEGRRRLAFNRQTLQGEIRAREQELTELTRLAQLHDPRFVWLENVAGMTVAELREALADDEAVIEYYFDGDELKIFVVDRVALRVIDAPCHRGQLKELILRLKFQLEKFHYGATYLAAHGARLLESANACLGELYRALFAPVAELVTNRRLILIPHDLLHNVPFQALHDGAAYLLDRHEISYAPSARLFALCTARPARQPERALIFGVADEVAPRISEEIRALQQLFPAAHCFTGSEARAQTLAEHLPASDLVHIACHAVFRQDNPMFSAFRLAGEWLNFYDICALRTQASLVVLSGCSTGVNRIYAGDELLGLTRGFLTAGAASLVVSLWAVNDPATAELMTDFYGRLRAGASPRAALREAALQLRQAYPHPYYWAPFVLTGRATVSD
jgi:CHAT domain-containing protein/tetratricopeptide (TPR) repeat protein